MGSIGEVAAVVTVAGILVYVVGLVGLAIAIRLRLADEVSTAWFVVALLPRTIVAGQGVKIWLTWPLPFAMLLVLLDISIENLTSSHELAVTILHKLTTSLGLGFLSVFLVLVLYSIRKTDRDNPDLVGHLIGAIFTATCGIFLIAQGALLVVQSQDALVLIQVVDNDAGGGRLILALGPPIQDVLSGTLLFLVGGFLVGVPAAATIDHPLPSVMVATDPTVVAEGLLASFTEPLYMVAHVDGTWHFLDDNANVLLCIPDRVVLGIRTLEKPPKSKQLPSSSTPHTPSKWARMWKRLWNHSQM